MPVYCISPISCRGTAPITGCNAGVHVRAPMMHLISQWPVFHGWKRWNLFDRGSTIHCFYEEIR